MKNVFLLFKSNSYSSKCRLSQLLILIFLSFIVSCTNIKHLNKTQIFPDAGFKTIHTLDAYAENNTIHILLSGVDKTTQKPALKYLQSLDAGETWLTPVTIKQGASSIKQSKRGNDFQIAAYGKKIMAVWRTQGGEPWTGKISVALSQDNGETWNKIASPVSDKYAKIDQGYFDLEADLQGDFHIAWLDDREEAGETQGLRYARFSNNEQGQWKYHSDLEQSACTCCWSSISSDSQNNIHVLFRNDKPRDMFSISSTNAGKSWQKSSTMWPFEWEFIGCPHQGGGIAATIVNNKPVLHSVVWNGNDSNRGLYYHSQPTNNKPLSIGDKSSASGDIATINNEHIGIVYITGDTEKKYVMVKSSEDGGESWSAEHRLSLDGAEPSHPKIIGTASGFRFFWTEWQENGDAIVMMSEI